MCAALFLNFHGSQGLSAPLQRARSPENLQHSGCYHRVDRNMIHFTYRHFQRDYSCRVHGALSVSHWLLWQARAPHRRIAPASASCDANLSMPILSHGTDGCQHITSILFISVYPFIICIFRARGKAASPLSRKPVGSPRSFMVSPNGQPPGGALATYQLQFCSKHGFGSHIPPPGQRRRFHCFGNTFFCKKITADGPKCMDQHPEMRRSAASAPFFDIKTSSSLLTSRRDDVIMFFMK